MKKKKKYVQEKKLRSLGALNFKNMDLNHGDWGKFLNIELLGVAINLDSFPVVSILATIINIILFLLYYRDELRNLQTWTDLRSCQ